MSSSESLGRGRLFIEGPPAGKIEIIDGAFNKIAEGTRELIRDDLTEGIYTVRWLGPAGEEEQNVRLFAGAELRLRGGFAGIGPGYEEIDTAAIISTLAPGAAATDPASVDSAIDFLVEAGEGQIQSDPARSLRLLALDGTEIEFNCARAGDEARHRVSCRSYRVAPGSFRLRCHGADHRWVEQIVHAFPGRRTMMFMNYGRAYDMRIRQGERMRTSLRGIVPAMSLAVSIPLSDEERPVRGAFPLHESLLHGLRTGAALVDEALIGELRRPETDPYAKLYAAILLLHRSLTPEPSREQRGLVASDQLREWAGEIVASMDASSCSDLDCLRWRLGLDNAGPGALDCPPMLANCWAWAVERSVDDPGAVPATPELIAAADALSTYLPWLVWNAVDARSAASAESFSADRLAALVVAIGEGIAHIRDQLGEDGNELLLAGGGHADLPLGLSDSSLRLVDDLERLQWTVRETTAGVIDPADIIRHLRIPAEGLLHRAAQALDEIERVDFTLRSTMS